jgi:hypothetical protein
MNPTYEDIRYLQKIFDNNSLTDKDIKNMYENKEIIKIADKNDYLSAYEDFCRDENNYNDDIKIKINYEKFICELKKGYGKSDCIQIARLFELSDGIYYDNEYCG